MRRFLTSASIAVVAIASTAVVAHADSIHPDTQHPPAKSAEETAETKTTVKHKVVKTDMKQNVSAEGKVVADMDMDDMDEMQDGKRRAEAMKDKADRDMAAARDNAESDMKLTLKADQLSAKELLGEAVLGSTGERIARIDDMSVDAEGNIDSVIFVSGDVFGLGGKRGALDFNRVSIAADYEHEPTVSVSMTEEAIKSVAAFEQNSPNDYSLASEMIGAKVRFMDTDDSTVVTDLIVDVEGKIDRVILADGILGTIGGDRRAVDFDMISVEEGDGGLVVNLDPVTFETKPLFVYK